jgi:beta-lactamase regulating signal transducer with metallopeptidase domain
MTIVVEGTLLSLSASAWLALLGELAIKGSLVLSAGWLISRSLMRAPAGVRSLVWTAVFAAVVVIPMLQVVRLNRPVRSEAKPWIDPLARHSIQLYLEDRPPTPAATSEVQALPVSAEPASWRPGYEMVVWVWLSGLIVLLLRLARDLAAGWWSLRGSRRPQRGELIQLVEQAREALGIVRPIELRLSATEKVPFVVGLRRPILVLPVCAAGWSRQALQASLLHEMAHIKRGDYLRLVTLRLACVALWFNPLVWWCARRAMLEIEVACDDRVLASGTSAIDYARHLLGLAVTTRRSPQHRAAVVALAERRQLEERVTMILNSKIRRLNLSRAAASACFALVMIVVLPLAAVQLVDRVAAEDKLPVVPAPAAAATDADLPEPAVAPVPVAVHQLAKPDLATAPVPPAAPALQAVVAPVAKPDLATIPEPAVAPVAEPVLASVLQAPVAPGAQAAIVEASSAGTWSVRPVTAEPDEELSRLLEELLVHLRKADKSDGRLQPGSIPKELVRKIVEQVINLAPAGQVDARFVIDTGDHSFGILIEKETDCSQPNNVWFKVSAERDDDPDYLLTIRCGDE